MEPKGGERSWKEPKGATRSIETKTYGLAYFVVGTDYPNNPKIL